MPSWTSPWQLLSVCSHKLIIADAPLFWSGVLHLDFASSGPSVTGAYLAKPQPRGLWGLRFWVPIVTCRDNGGRPITAVFPVNLALPHVYSFSSVTFLLIAAVGVMEKVTLLLAEEAPLGWRNP